MKSADFYANFDFFPTKILRNGPIFPQILTFSHENPAKSADFSATEALIYTDSSDSLGGSAILTEHKRLFWDIKSKDRLKDCLESQTV